MGGFGLAQLLVAVQDRSGWVAGVAQADGSAWLCGQGTSPRAVTVSPHGIRGCGWADPADEDMALPCLAQELAMD